MKMVVTRTEKVRQMERVVSWLKEKDFFAFILPV